MSKIQQLTTNQLILLLDIQRGFNRKAHTGTLAEDMRVLTRLHLIVVTKGETADENTYDIAPYGQTMISSMKASIARLLELNDKLNPQIPEDDGN